MKKLLIYCFIAVIPMSVVFITCSPTEPEKPQLSVNPTACALTKNVCTDNLIISNSGGGELSWEITDKPDWLEASKSSGKVTTGIDTVIITADMEQTIGTYTGAINITSNGGNQVVNVSLNISIWTEMKPMPTARFWFYCEAVHGKIYAIGGAAEYPGPSLVAVEEYDPVANTWTKKQDLIKPLGYAASAVVDEKIYVISPRKMLVYDPASDTWDTTKVPMPTERSAASACAVNGIIYVMGGVVEEPNEVFPNVVEAYDPATDAWGPKANMPTARHALGTAVVNGRIYAIGGGRSWNNHKVEEYDPITNRWMKKIDMAIGNGYFGCCVVEGIIYTIGGGYDPGSIYSRVRAYDPSVDKWSEKTAMPTARFALGAAAVNGKIYAIGGAVGWPPSPLSTVEEYEPALDSN